MQWSQRCTSTTVASELHWAFRLANMSSSVLPGRLQVNVIEKTRVPASARKRMSYSLVTPLIVYVLRWHREGSGMRNKTPSIFCRARQRE